MSKDRLKLSPRGHSLIIKGFLKNGNLDWRVPSVPYTTSKSTQLPKADLLTFWFLLFGLVLVMAPTG